MPYLLQKKKKEVVVKGGEGTEKVGSGAR